MGVVFFRTENGREPAQEFLDTLTPTAASKGRVRVPTHRGYERVCSGKLFQETHRVLPTFGRFAFQHWVVRYDFCPSLIRAV